MVFNRKRLELSTRPPKTHELDITKEAIKNYNHEKKDKKLKKLKSLANLY